MGPKRINMSHWTDANYKAEMGPVLAELVKLKTLHIVIEGIQSQELLIRFLRMLDTTFKAENHVIDYLALAGLDCDMGEDVRNKDFVPLMKSLPAKNIEVFVAENNTVDLQTVIANIFFDVPSIKILRSLGSDKNKAKKDNIVEPVFTPDLPPEPASPEKNEEPNGDEENQYHYKKCAYYFEGSVLFISPHVYTNTTTTYHGRTQNALNTVLCKVGAKLAVLNKSCSLVVNTRLLASSPAEHKEAGERVLNEIPWWRSDPTKRTGRSFEEYKKIRNQRTVDVPPGEARKKYNEDQIQAVKERKLPSHCDGEKLRTLISGAYSKEHKPFTKKRKKSGNQSQPTPAAGAGAGSGAGTGAGAGSGQVTGKRKSISHEKEIDHDRATKRSRLDGENDAVMTPVAQEPGLHVPQAVTPETIYAIVQRIQAIENQINLLNSNVGSFLQPLQKELTQRFESLEKLLPILQQAEQMRQAAASKEQEAMQALLALQQKPVSNLSKLSVFSMFGKGAGAASHTEMPFQNGPGVGNGAGAGSGAGGVFSPVDFSLQPAATPAAGAVPPTLRRPTDGTGLR